MNKLKIMLAMRPSVFRDDLVNQLGNKGFEVIIASEGNSALDKTRKYSVDALVTQLNLPQFDGFELILNLRDMRIGLPIIVISFEDSEMETEVLKAGASTFLRFPIKPDTIIDLLKHYSVIKDEHEECSLDL